MKWFHCGKDDNNDDITRIETANESNNGEVSWRHIRGIRKKVSSTKRMYLYVGFYVGKVMWLSSQREMESINILNKLSINPNLYLNKWKKSNALFAHFSSVDLRNEFDIE